MTWPRLDDETYLWMCHHLAAPALAEVADDLARLSGGAPLGALAAHAGEALAHAPAATACGQVALQALGDLPAALGDAHLGPWGKQLFRQAVRLLAAVSDIPTGRGDDASHDQAWIWAARVVHRSSRPLPAADRLAVRLIAGIVSESRTTLQTTAPAA